MERHILREETTSCPISSSGSLGMLTLAPTLQAVSSEMYDWFDSRSSVLCLNLTAWLSRGLLLVIQQLDLTASTHWHPPCLLITTWQLAKAHEVTRNEPNFLVICYKTFLCVPFFKMFTHRHFLRVSLHSLSTPHTRINFWNNSKNSKILKQLQGDLFTM